VVLEERERPEREKIIEGGKEGRMDGGEKEVWAAGEDGGVWKRGRGERCEKKRLRVGKE
jgi:hypothetical protein